jgi:hypothetical protein
MQLLLVTNFPARRVYALRINALRVLWSTLLVLTMVAVAQTVSHP